MKTEEMIEIMQAYVNGKQIQVCYGRPGDGEWIDIPRSTPPFWNWCDNTYRIKPKPTVAWFNVYNSIYWSGPYATKECADVNSCPQRVKCIKMVEVED